MALVACVHTPTSTNGGGDSGAGSDIDAGIFQECDTICLRPADCALAYSSGGICPPGFRCARLFSCLADASID
jgi:hypothetical protein